MKAGRIPRKKKKELKKKRELDVTILRLLHNISKSDEMGSLAIPNFESILSTGRRRVTQND
ncbi:MAG TPA: hypothetical protein VGQ59_15305 [Cyclobacteriaceae bacterium]|jgi:hypothetical protein|nr:hypothetical protein [Cyclobacteriaceae bacterium]